MTSKSEASYIQTSLLADKPLRADGRSLVDFRDIQLVTDVVLHANGSSRVSVGATEVIAACKLEVEDVDDDGGRDGGRISCSVLCSSSAYPHLSTSALDDLQHDLSEILNSVFAHDSIRPNNLSIIPYKKSWLLNLDCIVLADAGNIHDVLFIAARAALWDTRVPLTRPIEYKATAKETGDIGDESGLDTRQSKQAAADFELQDYWNEGEILDGRDHWPLCITLYLIGTRHFLDATLQEDSAVPLRLLLIFSFPLSKSVTLQGMKLFGSGELSPSETKSLLEAGQKYAEGLFKALNSFLPS